MDYVNFCRNYFLVTRIPVSLIKGKKPVYSTAMELLSLKPAESYPVFWEFSMSAPNPTFCRYSSDIEYGCVHIEETDYYVAVGPAFSIPVSDKIVHTYMRENALPLENREAVKEFLCSIPTLSHHQFTLHLALLHMSLNQKGIEAADFLKMQNSSTQKIDQLQTIQTTDNKENSTLHNTWQFEEQLWEHIKAGNVKTLERFLQIHSHSLNEGLLASTPLRQAKNLFIITVAKLSALAAIPGGIHIEQAYQLMEIYIQECEKLQTIEDVKNLQYSMLLDFCRRAGESRIPEGISSDVYKCMNYIQCHTNEDITIEDVASHIHKSTSYAIKHFKKELGINMGAFITRCKLEEAKSLLTHTDKSLAAISSYLCFSSQPHFQNLFKKNYGVTPLQYRKQHRKT